MHFKNYKNRLAIVKVMLKNKVALFYPRQGVISCHLVASCVRNILTKDY